MASGLPEKMSVTMVLAAIRRLQQRDCPGFSPDSLLITTHSSCLRRQKVAANQLRVQRYDFFPTPPNILSEICIYLTVIKQNSNKTYIKEAKTSKKQARLLFFRTIGPYGKRITFSKVSLPSRSISEYASYCNDYRHSMNGLRARYY